MVKNDDKNMKKTWKKHEKNDEKNDDKNVSFFSAKCLSIFIKRFYFIKPFTDQWKVL